MATIFKFTPPFTFINPERKMKPTDDSYGASWVLKPKENPPVSLAYIPGGKSMLLSVVGGELLTEDTPLILTLSDDKVLRGLPGRITAGASFQGRTQPPRTFGNSNWEQPLMFNMGGAVEVAKFWRADKNGELEAMLRRSFEEVAGGLFGTLLQLSGEGF